MKKTRVILLALLCIFKLNAYASLSKESDAAVVNTAIQSFMQKNDVPGVYVGLYHDGVSENYYFGEADKIKKTKVTNKTIFEVGSLTKLMTALLLAQQLDLAKAQLDNSVTDYLPELPASFEDITLKNLATHTSGLPFVLPDNIKTKADFETYLKTLQPTFSADEKYQYSNVGVGLLGIALEKMTKQKLDTLLQRNIGAPLHMQLFLGAVPKKYQKWQATGYDDKGLAQKNEASVLPASSDIKVSAEDMQRFLAASIGLANTPENISYPMKMTESAFLRVGQKKQGLSWQIYPLANDQIDNLLQPAPYKSVPSIMNISEMYEVAKFDGTALIDKTGATNGFKSYIAVIPNKQSGIVILANRKLNNNDMETLGREILFKLNDIHAEDSEEEGDARET